ncbi:hypothetical protein [Micromonospora craniellae]|uniref:Uncharacterized protein n=1 Tax=Micromonospora craniellae TaxID=2294034 RepID=A0A372FXM9_9ACTN|nr:hypothetical protein [Micromonospora craniellae]RFS45561.1 hypothetical protein D0Q02_15775 [Micromonospora craniellae]
MTQPAPPSLTDELARVTGDSVTDLRVLSRSEWFVLNPASVDTTVFTNDPIGYVAFDKQYFGVSVNWDAVSRWENAADQIDGIVSGMLAGVRGAEDLRTLDSLVASVSRLTAFFMARAPELRSWADGAISGNPGLGGTAVEPIVTSLTSYVDSMDSWLASMVTASGVRLPTAIDNARTLLRQFNDDVGGAWAEARGQRLRDRIRTTVEDEIAAIRAHLVAGGIVLGTPGYLFDEWAPSGDATLPVSQADLDAYTARTEARVLTTLNSYARGSLRSAATWTAINAAVTASVAPLIDTVSSLAQDRRSLLGTGYTDLTSGFIASTGGVITRENNTIVPPPQDGAGAGAPSDPSGGASGLSPGDSGGQGGSTGGPFPLISLAHADGSAGSGPPTPFPADLPGEHGSAPGGSPTVLVGDNRLISRPDGDVGADPFEGRVGVSLPLSHSDTAPDIGGSAGGTPPGFGSSPGGPPRFDGSAGGGRPGGGSGPPPSLVIPPLTTVPSSGGPNTAGGTGGREQASQRARVESGGATGGPAGRSPRGGTVPTPPVIGGAVGTVRPGLGPDLGLTLSSAKVPALDGRVGPGEISIGTARVGAPLLSHAAPGSSYQTPGFWPAGHYGTSPTQLAGTPVAYGTAGSPGAIGFAEGHRGLHLQDRIVARGQAPRFADLSGAGTSRPTGRDRVLPEEDEPWSDTPLEQRTGVVVTPDDDRENTAYYAAFTALTMPMLAGLARRSDHEEEDDQYKAPTRRGRANGVIDGDESGS